MTPRNNTLSRHLMTHLSPQITHLVSARPMSISMGNAIRQLKLEVSGSDIDLPEQDVSSVSPLGPEHVLTVYRPKMRCAIQSTITFGIGSFSPIKLYKKQLATRSMTAMPSSPMHGRCISASQPQYICLPLLAGHRWSRNHSCMPGNLASDFPSSSSIHDLC